jgi:hypothetical protein
VIRGGGVYLPGGSRRGPQELAVPVLRSVEHLSAPRVAKLHTAVEGLAGGGRDRLDAIGGRLANGQLSGDLQEFDVATSTR